MSLTYDDGLPCHYIDVAPKLEAAGLRGTFYVPIWGASVLTNPQPWQALAEAGHELGNHSLFHPCRQRTDQPYEWLDRGFDLRSYSRSRLRAELEVANGVLQLIDGRTDRSYGNTCSNTSIGEGDHEESMQPVLQDLFVAARGGRRERAAPQHGIDVWNVGGLTGDGRSFRELTDMVAAAADVRGWAVIMIHGVGEETHDWWLDGAVHAKFVDWLSASRDTVWTAPVVEVGRHVRRHCMAQPPSTTSD